MSYTMSMLNLFVMLVSKMPLLIQPVFEPVCTIYAIVDTSCITAWPVCTKYAIVDTSSNTAWPTCTIYVNVDASSIIQPGQPALYMSNAIVDASSIRAWPTYKIMYMSNAIVDASSI